MELYECLRKKKHVDVLWKEPLRNLKEQSLRDMYCNLKKVFNIFRKTTRWNRTWRDPNIYGVFSQETHWRNSMRLRKGIPSTTP